MRRIIPRSPQWDPTNRPLFGQGSAVPALVFLVLAAAVVLVWSQVRARQWAVLHGQTEVIAEQAAARIAEAVRVRLALVDQIRHEWLVAPFESREAFERRSLSLQRQFDGYLAVNWVDPQGIIRWVVPRAPNRAAENQDLHTHPFAAATFAEAESTGEVRVTPPVELYQGGVGFASYFPIILGDRRLGYLNGVFRARPLIEAALHGNILDQFSVAVRFSDLLVYTNRRPSEGLPGEHAASVPLEVAGQNWRVELAPGAELLRRSHPHSAYLLLVMGLALAASSTWFARLYVLRQEQVSRSEEKYRKLFEDSMDVVYISTPDGRFLDINEAGVKLFGGASKSQMLSVSISQDLYADAQDRREVIETLARDGCIRDHPARLRGLDGREIRARFSCTAVRDATGQIVAYRGVLHDESESCKLQEQITGMQRMESLSNLAGGIAHDFNNTLGAILGRASLLKARAADPRSRADAEAIEKSVEAAATLTSRLLAFARGDVQRRTAVDLNELVRRTVTILERTIAPNVTIVTDLDEDLPTVAGNEGQLQQVVLNLCINARDAMQGGGTLRMATRVATQLPPWAVSSSAKVAGPHVLLTVSDTGAGMDEEVRRRAFEPFFTTKPVGRGTGLGLAVVFGVVTGHGGSLNVESDPGQGTAVSVCLPVGEVVEGVEAVAQLSPGGGSETILVVDDDDALRSSLRDALEVYGYTTLEARDGEEAVAVFCERRREIDLVILDVTMPRLDGAATLARLREMEPAVRVIISTGYGRADGGQELLEAGGNAFLQKPYTIEALLGTIRVVLM